MIPYGRQDVTDEDVATVVEVLRSDFLTQGPQIARFEAAICEVTGAKHAVAVTSATAGLHIACLACDLGPGDWLWTVPNTYVASANAGLYCGAQVDFVDIEPDTLLLDCDALEQKLQATPEPRHPKVVIPVHFSGHACDLARLGELSRRYGFKVVEDASHAIGSDYRDRRVGGGSDTTCAVFSFHPVKIVTTGEGGVITTDDDELAARLSELRTHGVTRRPERMEGEPDGPWSYQLVELGYNYRITDVQAALGRSQLTRLDAYITRRNELIERYFELLDDLPVKLQSRPPFGRSAYHLAVIELDEESAGIDRRALFEALRADGIGVNVHYIPVHTQPLYRKLGFDWGDFPVSEAYYRRAITLPLFGTMTDAQQDEVVAKLRRHIPAAMNA